MNTDYEFLNYVKEKIQLIKVDTKNEYGYHKLIQTGLIGIYDYNTGYFDVSVYLVNEPSGNIYVRIWFGSLDDTDFGGWKKTDTIEEAKTTIDGIAQNIFKDMISLPTKDVLNNELSKYGINVGLE